MMFAKTRKELLDTAESEARRIVRHEINWVNDKLLAEERKARYILEDRVRALELAVEKLVERAVDKDMKKGGPALTNLDRIFARNERIKNFYLRPGQLY